MSDCHVRSSLSDVVMAQATFFRANNLKCFTVSLIVKRELLCLSLPYLQKCVGGGCRPSAWRVRETEPTNCTGICTATVLSCSVLAALLFSCTHVAKTLG